MQFQITNQHATAAADLTINRVYAKWGAITLVALFAFAFWRHHGSPEKLLVVLPLVACIFVGMYLPLFLFRRNQFIKQFTVNKELIAPMECDIVDGELVLKTDKTTTAIPRDRIIKVKANKQVTLLYRSAFIFHIIPTEVIEADPQLKDFIQRTS